jgi:hypothetical protein
VKIIKIAGYMVMAAAAVYVFFVCCAEIRIWDFYRSAHALLLPLKGSYEKVSASVRQDSPPMVMELPSGEWCAVVLEHDCCSGAGFNAVLIKDSEGIFYKSQINYCGYEGFNIANDIPDLRALRVRLLELGYKTEKRPAQ